MKANMN